MENFKKSSHKWEKNMHSAWMFGTYETKLEHNYFMPMKW